MKKISFFGLGNMGGPMAANLVKAGYEVCVYDLVPSAVHELVGLGAKAADTPEAVVADADIIISMLPAGKHVASLYKSLIGPADQPNRYLKKGALVIDCSTIDAATIKALYIELNNIDVGCIDAPVSGGVAGATNGTLSFMVGGQLEQFSAAKPILEVMGKNIFHAGEVGAGQIAKVCNNMLLSILMVGTSEALQLGIDNGLDPSKLSEIMSNSSGSNWTLDVYNPCPGVSESVPSSNDYKPGFMTNLMLKDLGLAMDTAIASGSSTPMGALTRNLYALHQKSGNGELDFSSIFKQFSQK
ncbi:3-hydroxyisobutyrate dehydrogenase [Psychrosphaera aestuarii]|uniref:3-hydroxyisobutyrate dehydrogenase n=1 Tax=Psychrosphaera aestuarii TaxID=1266052 RepID=UPI001B31A869|nr:3-hydroxyisobutyrate dehydrogenase [Psychrosphaera aestuarii]